MRVWELQTSQQQYCIATDCTVELMMRHERTKILRLFLGGAFFAEVAKGVVCGHPWIFRHSGYLIRSELLQRHERDMMDSLCGMAQCARLRVTSRM